MYEWRIQKCCVFLLRFKIAAAAAAVLMLGAAPMAAIADTDNAAAAAAYTADRYTAFKALGFTDAEIEQLRTASRTPNQFLAYCNIVPGTPFSGIPQSDIQVTRASTATYNGAAIGSQYIENPDSPYVPFSTSTIDYYPFNFNTDTSNLTRFQFPNIIRLKYTDSTSTTSLTVSQTSTPPAILDYGIVEAGNVSRYITGSTDTSSTVSDADATLVLQHYGNMLVYNPDPNWTDAASVAADVNCDNRVDAKDATAIGNYLLDTTSNFW